MSKPVPRKLNPLQPWELHTEYAFDDAACLLVDISPSEFRSLEGLVRNHAKCPVTPTMTEQYYLKLAAINGAVAQLNEAIRVGKLTLKSYDNFEGFYQRLEKSAICLWVKTDGVPSKFFGGLSTNQPDGNRPLGEVELRGWRNTVGALVRLLVPGGETRQATLPSEAALIKLLERTYGSGTGSLPKRTGINKTQLAEKFRDGKASIDDVGE